MCKRPHKIASFILTPVLKSRKLMISVSTSWKAAILHLSCGGEIVDNFAASVRFVP